MECVTILNSETAPITEEDQKLKSADSAEDFQHFIYDIFEKNGVLNDLRANLRGHIVEVLKSAQTGEPPTCQKHFTQRLDLTNQALNILVTEYLLRHEFNYSLSVFISEIPLANMVFGLAKTLMMQTDSGDHTNLWFSDSDVWSILNNLGIKCDSVHANNIVEKYNDKENPLLLCILKCLPFHCRQEFSFKQETSSVESTLSEKSTSDSVPEQHTKHRKGYHEKCSHYAYCKACQGRFHNTKEKYVKKKKHLAKNDNNIPPENTQNVENLMKNVNYAEKAIVDEMFHQLKSVYEAEVDLVKQEEEKKYKHVLAKYALHLQKLQTEMEQKFSEREQQLEAAVQQKKQFLWGLARSLRGQHRHLAAAMAGVRGHSERLAAKEDNLKTQLVEAENMIKIRGEDMRVQISNEILILEEHLESMQKERETIDKEKFELEKFKNICDSKMKLINDDSQIEELRKEIDAFKMLVEERKSCFAEKCVMTDSEGRMNNHEVGMKSDSEERVGRTPNQLVNDLKKQKNVNFNQSQQEAPHQESCRSRAARRGAFYSLRDENDRLKHFARQQEQHIDELNIQTARLRAELEAARSRERPRAAPVLTTNHEYFEPRLNTSISATYNTFAGLGAGEDSIFDAKNVPRNEPAQGRRNDSRRYLIQQWRALRRASPANDTREAVSHTHKHAVPTESVPSSTHSVDTEPMRETAEETNYYTEQADQEETDIQPAPEVVSESSKARCKSPKSMLKEAKMKLRNQVNIPRKNSQTKRDKSPNAVLREAKLRLRKLEIEAEAVEKSYLDFRKRQTTREETSYRGNGVSDDVTLDANIHVNENGKLQQCKIDVDRFLNKYGKKFSITESQFRNKSPNRARVIPESYVELDKKNVKRKDDTYLETPLTEFRKLYSEKVPPSKLEQTKAKHTIEEFKRSKNNDRQRQEIEDKTEAYNTNKKTEDKPAVYNTHKKTEEMKEESPKIETRQLQMLKDNINKIYNLKRQSKENNIKEITNGESNDRGNENLLRIEIESVIETNHLKLKECEAQDMLLVVQSTVDTANISNSDLDEAKPRMTVIVSPKIKNLEESEVNLQNQQSNILEEPEKLNPDLNTKLYIEKDVGSVRVEPTGGSQDILDSLSDRDKVDDYVDDFSADVDNYNSRSDYGEDNSPISHLKTSEDENFWDS